MQGDLQPNLNKIGLKLSPSGVQENKGNSESLDSGFADKLADALNQVNSMQASAEKTVEGALQGETEVHQAIMAMQKSDLSFQLMMQVRNKLVEAYQEVMRIQI